MTKLTEAEKIAKYDAERSGQIYVKDMAHEVWIDRNLAKEQPTHSPAVLALFGEFENATEQCVRVSIVTKIAGLVRADLDRGEEERERAARFGTLPDGTPIYGSFDRSIRFGCVSADIGDFSLTADDDGFISGNTPDQTVEFEGVTLAQLHALRDLLNTDTCERLLAAAAAWGRGDVEPPVFSAPAAPHMLSLDEQLAACTPGFDGEITLGTLPSGIKVVRTCCDYYLHESVDIERGNITITVEPDGTRGPLFLDGIQIAPSTDLDDIHALLALDHATVARTVAVGPGLTEAIKEWDSFTFDDMESIAQTIGFGAWYEQWRSNKAVA